MIKVYELPVPWDILDAAVNECLPGYAEWGSFWREQLTPASSQYHLADHDGRPVGSIIVRKLALDRSEIAIHDAKPERRTLTPEERASIQAQRDRDAKIARALELRRVIDAEREAEYSRRKDHLRFVAQALFSRLARSGIFSAGHGKPPEASATARVLRNVTIEDIADRAERLVQERGGVDIGHLGGVVIRQIGDQWWMADRDQDEYGHLKRFGLQLQRLAQHTLANDEGDPAPAGLMVLSIDLPTSGPVGTVELERIGIPAGVRVTIISHREEPDPAFEQLVSDLAGNWPQLRPGDRKAGSPTGRPREAASTAPRLGWMGKFRQVLAPVVLEVALLTAHQLLINMLTSHPEVQIGLTRTIVFFAICLTLYIVWEIKKALAR